jgi:maltooligosyltrehalose trehalohydrolase
MTALFLLMPGTPMLFQGQEMAASAPFLYFADHTPELARNVETGRAAFVAQFPSLASQEAQAALSTPHDPATFERCKLDWRERGAHAPTYRLHGDLLRLRREEPAFARTAPGSVDGAVLAAEAFVLRFLAEAPRDERLIVVNLGPDIVAASFAEPLVAPPGGAVWSIQWSSEHPAYGGTGTPAVAGDAGWRIPGHAAVVLRPEAVLRPETTDGRNGERRS